MPVLVKLTHEDMDGNPINIPGLEDLYFHKFNSPRKARVRMVLKAVEKEARRLNIPIELFRSRWEVVRCTVH